MVLERLERSSKKPAGRPSFKPAEGRRKKLVVLIKIDFCDQGMVRTNVKRWKRDGHQPQSETQTNKHNILDQWLVLMMMQLDYDTLNYSSFTHLLPFTLLVK